MGNSKYNILIVDDEESGRTTLKILLEKEFWAYTSSIQLGRSFEETKEKILANRFDIIFLDINLKGLSAFDLLSFIPNTTKIIFVTAYSEFAIPALRKKAFDYILKPIKRDELISCMQRLLIDTTTWSSSETLHIKEKGLTKILKLSEIIYIKGNGPYSTFWVDKENYTTSKTLKSILTELGDSFVRIHKSYVVNRFFVKGYNKEKLYLLNNICLPVSRSGLKNLSAHGQ
jgi:DNA-binding LytR/AlgR family response regulator